MVKVKNIHGTSKEKYAKSYPNKYKSWLDYWNDKCQYSLDKCANLNCKCDKEVGTHVIKEGSENDRSWYIVPLCKKCNHPSNEKYFNVNEKYLVPVSSADADYISNLIDNILNDIIIVCMSMNSYFILFILIIFPNKIPLLLPNRRVAQTTKLLHQQFSKLRS